MAGLEELGSPLLASSSSADILIAHRPGEEGSAMKAAELIRDRGLRCDVYLMPEAKMKKVYAYAENRAIPYLLTYADGTYTLKDLRTREERKAGTAAELLEGIAIG